MEENLGNTVPHRDTALWQQRYALEGERPSLLMFAISATVLERLYGLVSAVDWLVLARISP